MEAAQAEEMRLRNSVQDSLRTVAHTSMVCSGCPADVRDPRYDTPGCRSMLGERSRVEMELCAILSGWKCSTDTWYTACKGEPEERKLGHGSGGKCEKQWACLSVEVS